MKYGIVGYGVVGRHMEADIRRAGHACFLLDITPGEWSTQDEINACDCVFVCVGTPMGESGAADLSAIDEVFSWLTAPAIIRSTVPPGTTERVGALAFIPEFIGEGVNAPYNAMRQPPFLIVGTHDPDRAAELLNPLYNSECELVFVNPIDAEVAKYAENYRLALTVSWANEMYDICQRVGANYPRMMAAVTHDYRIGRSHTHVYPDKRGWGGRCLPKDLNALRARVGAENTPLLDALIRVNDKHRAYNALETPLGAASPVAGVNEHG